MDYVADMRSRTLPARRRRGVSPLLALAAAGALLAGCGGSSRADAGNSAAGNSPLTASGASGGGASGSGASGGGTSGSTSGGSSSGTATTTGGGATHHGNVDVLSAGSLETILTKTVGPAFHRATGYTLVDTSGGSSSLAAEIKGKTQVADVFVSASPAVNATLEGAANGDWVSWYATFAKSPLVLEYYPKSRFAHALRTRPWYDVITEKGFRLGRTNPAQDPGGVLDAEALDRTASARHLPALAAIAKDPSTEYSETALPGEVQSGQLDAAFAYLADANSTGLPHVDLTGVSLYGDYTVTLVNRAPHTAAAEAFIRYLTGPAGRAAFRGDQFVVVAPPRTTGHGVPAALRSTVGS